MSECGRKIRNANRMPKSDDRTESNLRRGRREGGREGGRKTRRRRGEVGWGEGRGERGEGRGERVLSSCSLSLEAVKHGHTISAVGVEPCTGRLYFSAGTRFMSTPS